MSQNREEGGVDDRHGAEAAGLMVKPPKPRRRRGNPDHGRRNRSRGQRHAASCGHRPARDAARNSLRQPIVPAWCVGSRQGIGRDISQKEEGLMKFIVATYGTEGDARPFAALCRGLMEAGHEARLLADAATLGSAQALGVPTTALAGDIRGVLSRDRAISGVVARGGGFNDTARALAKIANENAESWLRTIIEAGEGCDAVLVAGLTAFVGFSAAEYLGAKAIGAGMIPITPTAAFPSPFLPPKWVPRLLN